MAKKADEVAVRDSDLVYMVHPEVLKDEASTDEPSVVTYGAFRDCWSQLGWELATPKQVEAAGETVAEPDTAAVAAALVEPQADEADTSGKKEGSQ